MPDSADRGNGSGELRWNAWNLLLLVPFLILVTPWINVAAPRLFGMPFFYWVQLAWVPFSVALVAVVHVRTRGVRGPSVPAGPDDVDALDAGAAR
jgi:Protein of unknown function (DUF3311)